MVHLVRDPGNRSLADPDSLGKEHNGPEVKEGVEDGGVDEHQRADGEGGVGFASIHFARS